MKSVVLTLGLNHKTAPVRVREQIPTARCTREEARERLLLEPDRSLLPETFLLSTCNRTEIYGVAGDIGALLTAFLTAEPVSDYYATKTSDTQQDARFFQGMLEQGIYLAGSQFEDPFVSLAPTQGKISQTIESAQVLQALRQ
jgi:glutamate-1-semialdehyde aminotransferase